MKIIVIHVPKTAGSSLTKALRLKYGMRRVLRVANAEEVLAYEAMPITDKARFDAFIGHRPLHLLERELPGARTISIVREPIERQLSLYKHALRYPHHDLHSLAKMGPEKWLLANERDPDLAWKNSMSRWFWKTSETIGAIETLMERVELYFIEDIPALWNDLRLPNVKAQNVSPTDAANLWDKSEIERAESTWSFDVKMYQSLRALRA